jgi:hypothetical protein
MLHIPITAPRKANRTNGRLRRYGWEVTHHPYYSPLSSTSFKFRHNHPVMLVNVDLDPHKHNTCTTYVHLFAFLQRVSVVQTSGTQHKYIIGKEWYGRDLSFTKERKNRSPHRTLFYLRTLVLYQMIASGTTETFCRKHMCHIDLFIEARVQFSSSEC